LGEAEASTEGGLRVRLGQTLGAGAATGFTQDGTIQGIAPPGGGMQDKAVGSHKGEGGERIQEGGLV
jgi:hypothetical protein